MGIRVDAEAQGCWQSLDVNRSELPFHKMALTAEKLRTVAAALAKAVFVCCC